MPDIGLLGYLIFGAVVLAVIVGVLALLLWRRSDGATAVELRAEEAAPLAEEPEQEPRAILTEAEVDEVDLADEIEGLERPGNLVAPPTLEAPPKPKPRTARQRLVDGLGKSRSALSARLAEIAGRGIDESAWEELEEALIRADVGVQLATEITENIRGKHPTPDGFAAMVADELHEAMSSRDASWGFAPDGPSVWLVVGVNGVGKTTSIAKLAHLLRSQGKEVVLAAADTFRAAAIDQLGSWAARVGVHMVRHAPGADPTAVVFDAISYAKARGIDVVIADTAGRIHTKSNLMEELAKIRRVADREATISEVLLVLDATVGQNGLAQAKSFKEAVDITGVILTKLDGTARGGIVLAVQKELGVGVKAIGVGEDVEDLQPFDAGSFTEALIEA